MIDFQLINIRKREVFGFRDEKKKRCSFFDIRCSEKQTSSIEKRTSKNLITNNLHRITFSWRNSS